MVMGNWYLVLGILGTDKRGVREGRGPTQFRSSAPVLIIASVRS